MWHSPPRTPFFNSGSLPSRTPTTFSDVTFRNAFMPTLAFTCTATEEKCGSGLFVVQGRQNLLKRVPAPREKHFCLCGIE